MSFSLWVLTLFPVFTVSTDFDGFSLDDVATAIGSDFDPKHYETDFLGNTEESLGNQIDFEHTEQLERDFSQEEIIAAKRTSKLNLVQYELYRKIREGKCVRFTDAKDDPKLWKVTCKKGKPFVSLYQKPHCRGKSQKIVWNKSLETSLAIIRCVTKKKKDKAVTHYLGKGVHILVGLPALIEHDSNCPPKECVAIIDREQDSNGAVIFLDVKTYTGLNNYFINSRKTTMLSEHGISENYPLNLKHYGMNEDELSDGGGDANEMASESFEGEDSVGIESNEIFDSDASESLSESAVGGRCSWSSRAGKYCSGLSGTYTTGSGSLSQCKARCASTSNCKAVTYYAPYGGTSTNRCYLELKSSCGLRVTGSGGNVYLCESGYILVRKNAECNSSDKYIGKNMNVASCGAAVAKKGGRFFVIGIGGKRGYCYQENTRSATCPEGWASDQYNFYMVTGKASKTNALIQARKKNKSDGVLFFSKNPKDYEPIYSCTKNLIRNKAHIRSLTNEFKSVIRVLGAVVKAGVCTVKRFLERTPVVSYVWNRIKKLWSWITKKVRKIKYVNKWVSKNQCGKTFGQGLIKSIQRKAQPVATRIWRKAKKLIDICFSTYLKENKPSVFLEIGMSGTYFGLHVGGGVGVARELKRGGKTLIYGTAFAGLESDIAAVGGYIDLALCHDLNNIPGWGVDTGAGFSTPFAEVSLGFGIGFYCPDFGKAVKMWGTLGIRKHGCRVLGASVGGGVGVGISPISLSWKVSYAFKIHSWSGR